MQDTFTKMKCKMKATQLVSVLMLTTLIFVGCKKQVDTEPVRQVDPFVTTALEHLRQNLSEGEYQSISKSSYSLIAGQVADLKIIRFAVIGNADKSITVSSTRGKLASSWFEMDGMNNSSGRNRFVVRGISERKSNEVSYESGKLQNIKISENNNISELNIKHEGGRQVVESISKDGKMHPDDEWLPEITVTAYIGGSSRTFYSLFWLSNMNYDYFNAYTGSNLYVPLEGEGGGGGGNGHAGGSSSGEVELILVPAFEFEDRPALNIDKALKCFDNILSEGAKYSMTLYVDIPVNDDVNQMTRGLTPGHTFIGMTKSNGSESVTQVFGFYPSIPALSIFNVAVNSTIRNDSGHEYDASITIDDLDAASFGAAAELARYNGSGKLYDLNDFNCTNYAVEVFNKAMPLDDQLTAPAWEAGPLNLSYGLTPNALSLVLGGRSNNGLAKTTMGTAHASSGQGECQ